MPSAPSARFQIRSLRVEPYALPFRTPFRTAHGTLAQRQGFVVWVEDENGTWGVGEAAPLEGFGMESHAECQATLERLQARLAGLVIDVPETGEDWAAPLKAEDRTSPAACHGVECALLHLAALRRGLPLARWLCAQAPASVALNATVGADTPQEAARQALEWTARGFGTLKLKVGVGGAAADVARLAAVRSAVGNAVKLRVDANGAWSEPEALETLDLLAPYHLEYCEQPVPAGDWAALARVCAASPVPIAADEAASSESQALAILEHHAAHVLVLKPMALGGLTPLIRIARRAVTQGVPVVVTTMLEGAYARWAALHGAAALAGILGERVPLPACGLATGPLLAQDLTEQVPLPIKGHFVLPSGPGLGLEGLRPRPSGL